MLLESYCSRLGSLVEHRYSSLALLEAKQQAEKAAIIAHEAMLKAKAADRAKSKFLANMAFARPSMLLSAFPKSSNSTKSKYGNVIPNKPDISTMRVRFCLRLSMVF